MKRFVGFADGSEGMKASSNIDASFNLLGQGDKQSLEYIVLAQKGKDSSAMVQLEAAGLQVTPATMPNQNTCAQSKADKKRASDKAHRERLKTRKIEMMCNMEVLTKENIQLKNKNGALQDENTHMNQTLQSQSKEIDQLKNNLYQLKHEYEKQNALLQTLSEILANSDLGQENQRLLEENVLLRQNIDMDSQGLQLMEENLKLKHERRILKVQVDALCEKLIIDNSKNAMSKYKQI